MIDEKIVILADKNVANFLSKLSEPIADNERLFVLDEKLGIKIKQMINEIGLIGIEKILKEGCHEEDKNIKKSFF